MHCIETTFAASQPPPRSVSYISSKAIVGYWRPSKSVSTPYPPSSSSTISPSPVTCGWLEHHPSWDTHYRAFWVLAVLTAALDGESGTRCVNGNGQGHLQAQWGRQVGQNAPFGYGSSAPSPPIAWSTFRFISIPTLSPTKNSRRTPNNSGY